VLLGEPVGSCTDLSATVLQPIKQAHGDRFRVAPLSVLVDVNQVRALDRIRQSVAPESRPRFPKNVMYIYRKQLEEADLIVLNKVDLLPADELARLRDSLVREFPGTALILISAIRGDGVDQWLDFVLADRPAGQTITEVDYDQYAEGEAALGWLNAEIRLHALGTCDWGKLAADLLGALQARLGGLAAEIAHVKLRLTAGGQSLVANATSNDAPGLIRGAVPAQAQEATMLLNARVRMEPDQLQAVVLECLRAVAGEGVQASVEQMQSFAPARPQPTHRFSSVV